MLCSFLLEFALVLPVLRVALAAPVAETSNALAPRCELQVLIAGPYLGPPNHRQSTPILQSPSSARRPS
jgi:hypothetical protein